MAVIGTCQSWTFSSPRRLAKAVQKAAVMGGVSASMLAAVPQVARAEPISVSVSTEAQSDGNTEQTETQKKNEEARVQRKLEKQRAMSGSSSSEEDASSRSFMGSLRKEKAKQQGQKKTKAEKAAALCETLGRGC